MTIINQEAVLDYVASIGTVVAATLMNFATIAVLF